MPFLKIGITRAVVQSVGTLLVFTSLKNELEDGSNDVTSRFEYSCSYRTIALWVWRLLNRFSIPALEGNTDL